MGCAHFGQLKVRGRYCGRSFEICKDVSTCADNHICYPFWLDARLQAVLVHRHDGSAIIIYNMYGPAGARESASAKRYLRNMLQAISSDAAVRALPALLVGDFNSEIEATPFLQSMLVSQWHDLAHLRRGGLCDTSHKGSGSRIAHIWCNTTCLPLIFHFDLQCNPFTDNGHDILEVGFHNYKQATARLTPRQGLNFDRLNAAGQLLHIAMPQEFFIALEAREVNQAAALWPRQAEKVLLHLHHEQIGLPTRQFQQNPVGFYSSAPSSFE